MHRVITLAHSLPLVWLSCLENRNTKKSTGHSMCVSFLSATFTANMFRSDEYSCDRYDILATFVLWTLSQISMVRACLCCTLAVLIIMRSGSDYVRWNNYRMCIGYKWTTVAVNLLPNLRSAAKTTALLLLATILASPHKQPRSHV
jgi:hypothetical protein